MKNVEQPVDKELAGKPKYWKETYPNASLSPTNPTLPEPFSNPGLRGGKPATNRLSYGTAITPEYSSVPSGTSHRVLANIVILCTSVLRT
jgi:hypothetical protein